MAGRGGADGGSTTNLDCSITIRSVARACWSRRCRRQRSHHPCEEADKKAECGKSARSDGRGGNWKRGHGGTVNPPFNRKRMDVNPPPTGARASSRPYREPEAENGAGCG